MTGGDAWVRGVLRKIQTFARQYDLVVSQTKREVSASFEIGCFHALTDYYSAEFKIHPRNLSAEGEYRYLTSPSGRPDNFSYLDLELDGQRYQLRQQVRIRSERHRDVYFTPDMVVLNSSDAIVAVRDDHYARGKRDFLCAASASVVAAHECKSMNPFPELLVSFLGLLYAGHAWLDRPRVPIQSAMHGRHLAPTLFVGGAARALHMRMVRGLEATYPLNIVVGLHAGSWNLRTRKPSMNILVTPRGQAKDGPSGISWAMPAEDPFV